MEPTLIKKAANFTKAVIKHAADGLERLTEEEYLARVTVCIGSETKAACDALNTETSVCRDYRCGCSIRKKAYWRSEDCPRGQWPNTGNSED